MFQMKAISVSRHHRKSSSVFDISFCALILIHGSGFIVWTIKSLFSIGRCFPMEHSSPYFLLKTQSFYGLTLNGTHKKRNQPKMVVSNWMRSHRVVWSVSNRASVWRHTFFASSANEFPWASTLECPKHICTRAAILAWIACTARTFVDVWEKTQAWTFFAWFSFCILTKLLVTFYIFKRTVLPRYPKQLSLLTNHFR